VLRRVDQLLSSLGYCSRKAAQELCDQERLTLDGTLLTRASQRVEGAQVRLDGEPLEFPDGLVVMLHKPLGYVCSHDERDGRMIYELLPERWRRRDPVITTVGRLDKETSGVLLVTDDGKLVHRLTSPRYHVEKVYLASLDGPVTDACRKAFATGVTLESDEEPTLPAGLEVLADGRAQVTVHEGRYHQVRRMFAACGLHVTALERTRVGPWSLGDLPSGAWRELDRAALG